MSATETAEGDMVVAGNLLVAERAYLRGNLRCDGHARLGREACIDGNVDASEGVEARAGVRVRGAVTCAGPVDWQPSAEAASLRCDGPLRVAGKALAASLDAAEGIGPASPEEIA